MANRPVLAADVRDKLVERIKSDPKFREQMKTDWVAAFRESGINPADVKGKVLDHSEVVPFGGGSKAMSGIHITITIFAAAGMERIDIRDAVTFDEKLTK
jgi:hypothetical protein